MTGAAPYYQPVGVGDLAREAATLTGPVTPALVTLSKDRKSLYLVVANGSWERAVPCTLRVRSFRAEHGEGRGPEQPRSRCEALAGAQRGLRGEAPGDPHRRGPDVHHSTALGGIRDGGAKIAVRRREDDPPPRWPVSDPHPRPLSLWERGSWCLVLLVGPIRAGEASRNAGTGTPATRGTGEGRAYGASQSPVREPMSGEVSGRGRARRWGARRSRS